MKKDLNEEHKEEFQLERVAFFSDAVFAIAITLLIIEIRVPEIHAHKITDKEILNEFVKLIPKFIGFIVSFMVIALYWLSHHRIFRYVTSVNQKLIWSNLLFLLPIIVMPFSTAFLSEYYSSSVKFPLIIYTLTICLSGFFNFRIWKIIGNKKNNLSSNLDKVIVNYNCTRALTVPILFIMTLLLSFLTNWAFILPILILFVPKIITRYYTKKYPEIMDKYNK
ncbi:TMEM175 family protein [Algoriella sp.]|uniref:TMEM175 family protein n=1 Tax=Algoriella sp. TaxID=1872434 RepID=UPI001B17D331|nr:TMEM175 family protein [Algoriella sp.]MBO6211523.1 DUF1211 domain-containing protein [Algoriella sp.]